MSELPEFAVFFRSLWSIDPFPWQERLARKLCETGRWPEWITLPTGTGKTACLDIAIYHLATQSHLPLSARSAPVRIVLAVNRRIVVDGAYDRMKKIADRLRKAQNVQADPLHLIAAALQNMAKDETAAPLYVYPLRGGMFTDHTWARTPTQPLVLTTTLDQLGSRLLFRGYGVSEYARPLHAALLANDALLMLDEAHTSKAFSQTLKAVTDFRSLGSESLSTPFQSVQLTATPPEDAADPFELDEQDKQHSDIKKIVDASKLTELISVDGARGAKRHAKLAVTMVKKTIDRLEEGTKRILIVVNRVGTAEKIFTSLNSSRDKRVLAAKIQLLTGRLRPLDREPLIKEIDNIMKSEGTYEPKEHLVVVATQCIEVGADYDFDALLTELAPLDCLRQRLGRLNRKGRKITASAVIFAPEELSSDPIYGNSLDPTWKFLKDLRDSSQTLDLGISAFQTSIPTDQSIRPMLAPAADAPILLPTHLDLLCQTSPPPHAEPEPGLYIHGPEVVFPETYVVFRADIDGDESSASMIEAFPPLSTEAATVPLYLLCQLLENHGNHIDDSGDVPDRGISKAKGISPEIQVWRYRDKEAKKIENTSEIHPGDFVILPKEIDRELLAKLIPFASENKGPWEVDQYERAFLIARDKLRLRFHNDIVKEIKHGLGSDESETFDSLVEPLFQPEEDETKDDLTDRWKDSIPKIARLLATDLPEAHPWKEIWRHAEKVSRDNIKGWKVVPMPEEGPAGVILEYLRRVGDKWPVDPDDLMIRSTAAHEEVLLEAHSRGVSRRAQDNGTALPSGIVDALRDAGLWHDLGKLDPRFQSLLHGVGRFAASNRPALAKSGGGARPKHIAFSYYQRSGLPKGFRHELLSALIVGKSEALKCHSERELLLHLVASHHGRCRALAPVVADPTPEHFQAKIGSETVDYAGVDCPLARFEEGVAQRFWSLTRRFGWWGLPYLETLLRLADQRESAHPSDIN